jgi:hypothetical protein
VTVTPKAENRVDNRFARGSIRYKIRCNERREQVAQSHIDQPTGSQATTLIYRTLTPNTTKRNRTQNRVLRGDRTVGYGRRIEPENPESVGVRPAAPDTKPKTEAQTRPIGGNLRDGLGAISSAGCACLSAQTNGFQAQRQRPRGSCPEVRSILVGKCTQNVHILGDLGKGVSSCTF